eukprot:gene12162-15274_t
MADKDKMKGGKAVSSLSPLGGMLQRDWTNEEEAAYVTWLSQGQYHTMRSCALVRYAIFSLASFQCFRQGLSFATFLAFLRASLIGQMKMLPMLVLLFTCFDNNNAVRWSTYASTYRTIQRAMICLGWLPLLEGLPKLTSLNVHFFFEAICFPLAEPIPIMHIYVFFRLVSIPIFAIIYGQGSADYKASCIINVFALVVQLLADYMHRSNFVRCQSPRARSFRDVGSPSAMTTLGPAHLVKPISSVSQLTCRSSVNPYAPQPSQDHPGVESVASTPRHKADRAGSWDVLHRFSTDFMSDPN